MAIKKLASALKQIIKVYLVTFCILPVMFAQTAKYQPPNAQTGNPNGVIMADTVLSMRMNDSLNSKNSRVGDKFTATVTTPVYVNGRVAIPSGAIVEGKVTQVTPARRMNKGGTIGVEFEEIILPNGMSTKIDGILTSDDPEIQKRIDEENRMSGGKSKDTAIFVGQSGAIGAVLGGITGGGKGAVVGGAVGAGVGLASVLFSKGEEAAVPAGTTFGIRLKQALPVPDDMDISANANQQSTAPDSSINPDRSSTNPSGEIATDSATRDNPNPKNSNSPPPIKEETSKEANSDADEHRNDSAPTDVNLPLSSPEMIRKAQQALSDHGYYEGEINGEMTPRTQKALKTFQHDNRLPETGLLDIETARSLRIVGMKTGSKSAQGNSPQTDSGISSRQSSSSQPNNEGQKNATPLSETNRQLIQIASNIQSMSANLLAEYQQMIGARMTDNGIEFENGSKHNDSDIELLFALDSFANAATLYNRMLPSLRTSSAMRNATLSLSREARRTDKVVTTSSSRWTNELTTKWDNIRQTVLRMMSLFNIKVGELDI